jgi:opacity protein-like surface antigen
MFSHCKIIPAIGTLAFMFGGAANAADLPASPPLLQSAPLLVDEFSSGWYLRGDVGYRFNNDFDGVSNLGAPPGVRDSELDTSWLVGAGVGYKWEWFRTDLTVDYGTKAKFTGGNRFGPNDYTGKIDSFSALVNIYGDLGTWWGLTPYVGGGIGIARPNTGDFTVASAGNLDIDTAASWNFAWALMAGVSYRLMGNYHIDVGYRHINMGDVTTGRDSAGNQLAFQKLSADEVRFGFRYVLD